MINLDERYQSYLHTNKCFVIDGKCEHVVAYGFRCNTEEIIGYYVRTKNYKLLYDLNEQCIAMEEWSSG